MKKQCIIILLVGVFVLAAGGLVWAAVQGKAIAPALSLLLKNKAPVGESFSIDAGHLATSSVDLTSHLSDADGDTLTTALVGSGVLLGDPDISTATIVANVATISVAGGTGNAYIDYTVSDGQSISSAYRITIMYLDGM